MLVSATDFKRNQHEKPGVFSFRPCVFVLLLGCAYLMNPERKHTSDRLFTLVSACLLLALSLLFYRDRITSFPSHIHAWTQSDRLALSYGFIHDGFDLFHPSTYNLHPEYQPKKTLEKETGITRVDFPLVEYVVALLMKVTTLHEPVVFRLFVLLCSLGGIIVLLRLFGQLGMNDPMKFVMLAFVFSAPVYAYFQAGFIPSVPAVALTFLAFYALFLHLRQQQTRQLVLAISALTLAALIRMPFTMPLAATLLSLLVFYRKSLRWLFLTLSLGGLSVIVVLAYLLYNEYLGNHYGSLFISRLMPAVSVADFGQIMNQSWANWKWHYFTGTHYVLLAAGLCILVVKFSTMARETRVLIHIALFSLLLALAYLVVMAKQFIAHDYYLLDAFFIPLVILSGIGLSRIMPQKTWQHPALWLIATLLVFFMVKASLNIQAQRYITQSWDRTETTRLNFTGSKELLDKAGISAAAKILVLDSYTYNAPLLLAGRRGYTVINTTPENISKALTFGFDYIVVQNRFLASDVLRNYPALGTKLQPVTNNGRIGVYTLGKDSLPDSFSRLLMLAQARTLFQLQDSTLKSTGIVSAQEVAAEFIPLIRLSLDSLNMQGEFLVFEMHAMMKEYGEGGLFLVTLVRRGEKQYFYDGFDLMPFFEHQVTQSGLAACIQLPAGLQQADDLSCYIWNPGRHRLDFSEMHIQLITYLPQNLTTFSHEKH